jgi:sugar lactone lactonase YvrE
LFPAIIFLFVSLFSSKADTLTYTETLGSFQNAASISASRDEFIFVSDVQSNQLYKYNLNGKLLQTFGGTGINENSLNGPVSIDASNGLDVYVCDNRNNRIQRYDIDLHYIATFSLNTYNLTAENSRRIFYPYGIAFLNTSEIFILADATNYKAAKLKSFEDVSNVFGSSNIGADNLVSPKKIIKGADLDVWILDAGTNDIVNFDNYGTYIKRLKNPDNDSVYSVTFYGNCLYILKKNAVAVYDLTKSQYSGYYFIENTSENIKDLAVINKNNILILTNKKIYKYITK